ncbi:uncharacterized protein BCR38DRAFT_490653 [Pseudomassariella vexata]|uniref:FAD-binding PCMH-type domain-containing protein n=1 Tax=Pseudomassariella vexata TaxID=1141098 RepID=A0A1Y2DAQ5_9PEZI|nr:uncharacterized protein BCR38DRAFT_490653 [Pseudomassariella vexata]ORY56350.1 hypothetical protein BCR38DRAFT_490653 [Pseudomassariella vexata]
MGLNRRCAGFLTGGGNSFFASAYNFGCDNVNFKVVLGDETIVNANKSSNLGRGFALKGGHGNLGVVIRFGMTAIPPEKLFKQTVDLAALTNTDKDDTGVVVGAGTQGYSRGTLT